MRNMLHILFLFLYLPVVAQQPIEEGHKLINGVELYYQIIGEGEPIVLLHGGPGMDESYFHPGIDPLGKSYRLITYDQRGVGKSKGPLDTLQLIADQFVEDLEGLRQALELEKMHLVGHSWGGLLAMFYAIKYPENLQSLLLVSSAGADTSFSKSHMKTAYERLSPEDREAIANMTEAGYFNSKEGLIKVSKILWKPFVADQQKVKLIKDAVSDHTPLIKNI